MLPPTGPKLTAAQRVLLVARDLAGADGKGTFRAEQLVVAAWRRYPATFGLKGFTDQYPCSNTTFVVFMGGKGLVRLGWLDRAGPKLYRLSAAGAKEAARLAALPPTAALAVTPPPRPGRLTGKQADRLGALLGGAAMRKWRVDLASFITYPEAAEFWGFAPSERVRRVVEGQVRMTPKVVAAARARVTVGGLVLPDGRVVGAAELDALDALHAYLLARFRRDLDRQTADKFRRLA